MDKKGEESVTLPSQGIERVGTGCTDEGYVVPQKTAGKVITCRGIVLLPCLSNVNYISSDSIPTNFKSTLMS